MFFKKKAKGQHNIIKIAGIISGEDDIVMKEAAECVASPEMFFKKHIEKYQERGIEVMVDSSQIQWLGLVDILDKYHYVCERDWSDEKEDFFYFVRQLKGMNRYQLPLEEEWLEEDGDVAEWCTVLDEKWEGKRVCMAALDIESDSYVLFPCKLEELEELGGYGEEIGHRIDFAKDM